ncbi:transient receptor potential cation channel subfamily M member 2 isoform X2 [Erinaceus europaeus]|uniref:Transient receptor potential cation channel subfamily M member 2 isoform X2 n=1 Tax=Erinaceus europaeus TaxID=9365 RepID=A0ABM3WVK1_ERIEU|nr:transient receptor potential cation channel subfamily M member 2 isoform X2 [Erinaceus europaeus]
MHDLLIWAIVQNHRELAEIIWAQSRDSIAAGLACSRMLRELAREGLDAKRLDATRALANEFESKAIGVFTECCREDREQAEKLLTRVSEAWGGSTCLQLALDAGAMQFMAQGGVQAYLTKVWWGELQEDTGLWRVALCLLTFPLLCTSLVTFRDSKLRSASSLRRVRAFFNAPVVTFLLNILSYFAFLCLFAYVLMVDFQPTPSWSERFIYLWVFSLVCEELRQLFYSPDGSGLAKRASVYFGDFWNKLDVTAILLFVAGLACRLLPALLYSGRVLLALDFILLCLRLLHIFTVSRMLGPKIIILKRMMKDIFFFLLLLAVWVVSFGVAKQAILIHNESRTDWLFRGVLYHSYLTIFGQIPPYIDGVDFDPDHCSPDGSDPYKPKCPESDPSLGEPAFPQWLTVTLLCLHLLVTNILLLNLLIAMFNYTFQEVQECTDQVWKFQRLHLIQEYQARPPAPPPFILLGHLQLLFLRLVLKVPPQRHRQFNNKLVETEEAPLLSWEAYLKEHYLHGLQSQRQQSLEQRVRDIGDKVDAMMDLLEVERGRRWGSSEQRPASLEEQTLRSAGLVSEGDVPCLAPRKGPEEQEQEQDPALESRLLEEDPTDTHHISARQLLYPSSSVERFPVPNEKVPWEEEFLIYNPSFYTAEKSGPVDPDGSNRALLGQILYNAVDGAVDRRSFHGPYEVQDGLPRNPRGRTGLQGRGALSRFGPNHKLQPVVTRWRRNQDGVICRRNFRKVLEVLLLTSQQSEPWALPGGSQDPGEMLPQKFKAVIPGELHKAFGNLLDQGTQVYRGYVDHPRNTDNAWVEMVAVSIHFSSQNDETLWKLNQYLKGLSDPPGGKRNVEVCWQLVDKHIPLYPDHKAILRKVATHYEAHY